ncbi:hypothetical protein Bca101_046125 [Brassica carinata]
MVWGVDPEFLLHGGDQEKELRDVGILESLKNYEKSGVPKGALTDFGDAFNYLRRKQRLVFRLHNPHSKSRLVSCWTLRILALEDGVCSSTSRTSSNEKSSSVSDENQLSTSFERCKTAIIYMEKLSMCTLHSYENQTYTTSENDANVNTRGCATTWNCLTDCLLLLSILRDLASNDVGSVTKCSVSLEKNRVSDSNSDSSRLLAPSQSPLSKPQSSNPITGELKLCSVIDFFPFRSIPSVGKQTRVKRKKDKDMRSKVKYAFM